MSSAAPSSVAFRPTTDATGPASAKPRGMVTSEPSQSYALTRASACGGTCSCSVVVHVTIAIVTPIIASTDAPVIASVGAGGTRSTSWRALTSVTPNTTTSGREGVQRSAIAPPSREPSALPLMITPQSRAPPSSR